MVMTGFLIRKLILLLLFLTLVNMGGGVSLAKADISHWVGEEIGVDISHWSDEEFGVDISAWAGENAGSINPSLIWVGGTATGADSGTDLTINVTSLGIQSGYLVLASCHINSNLTIADNNGGNAFAEADEDYFNSEDRALYWRIATGSETSYSWTASGSNRWVVAVLVFRPPSGLSVQSPPFDVAPATVTTASGTSIQAPAQTGTTDHVTWLAFAYVDGAETFTAFPSGWVQGAHRELNQPISAYFKTDQNSGTTGTADWTLNAASATGAEIIILKQAS